jgi:hypothetical protein
MSPLLARFKSALKTRATFTQMVSVEEARALWLELRKLGFVAREHKTGHRLLHAKGYFTVSPKGERVHILAKKY